jgi:hypothetical protein
VSVAAGDGTYVDTRRYQLRGGEVTERVQADLAPLHLPRAAALGARCPVHAKAGRASVERRPVQCLAEAVGFGRLPACRIIGQHVAAGVEALLVQD